MDSQQPHPHSQLTPHLPQGNSPRKRTMTHSTPTSSSSIHKRPKKKKSKLNECKTTAKTLKSFWAEAVTSHSLFQFKLKQ